MSAVPTFADLGVSPNLVPALKRGGIEAPFPIQVATLPDAIAGRDILGRGQTGSGKTLAFGLALLTRLNGRTAKPKLPLGLVLAPTRELAMQISDTLSPLAHSLRLDVRLIAGGMPYAKQLRSLDKGVEILVATPGRLVDLINRGAVDLSEISVTVIDEADHLAARGVPVGALHGGKSQAVRTRTLDAFRKGDTAALVATDVAARGIHVDGISLVVHVDSPTDPKDYLHRAGRTARAGESGTVVTLASPRQQRMVSSLTKRAGVEPCITRVRPGDDALTEVTGAQQPSGVPWTPPAEPKRAPARSNGRPFRPGSARRAHPRHR
jgi:superfamily II DNA/RNA helicase